MSSATDSPLSPQVQSSPVVGSLLRLAVVPEVALEVAKLHQGRPPCSCPSAAPSFRLELCLHREFCHPIPGRKSEGQPVAGALPSPDARVAAGCSAPLVGAASEMQGRGMLIDACLTRAERSLAGSEGDLGWCSRTGFGKRSSLGWCRVPHHVLLSGAHACSRMGVVTMHWWLLIRPALAQYLLCSRRCGWQVVCRRTNHLRARAAWHRPSCCAADLVVHPALWKQSFTRIRRCFHPSSRVNLAGRLELYPCGSTLALIHVMNAFST